MGSGTQRVAGAIVVEYSPSGQATAVRRAPRASESASDAELEMLSASVRTAGRLANVAERLRVSSDDAVSAFESVAAATPAGAHTRRRTHPRGRDVARSGLTGPAVATVGPARIRTDGEARAVLAGGGVGAGDAASMCLAPRAAAPTDWSTSRRCSAARIVTTPACSSMVYSTR